MKRAPPNGIICYFAHMSEIKPSAVIVVQSTQDWEGEDLATIVIWRDRLTILFWNLLFEALMRSGSIEVLDIGMQDTMSCFSWKMKR